MYFCMRNLGWVHPLKKECDEVHRRIHHRIVSAFGGNESVAECYAGFGAISEIFGSIGLHFSFRIFFCVVFCTYRCLLTCLVQASAAMMAITLVMCYKGWIGFDMAVALVMGQNIGTAITANLAAMVANTAGKKAARAHLVFNVLGVIITLLAFRPIMNLIAAMTTGITGSTPYLSVGDSGYLPESIPMALSIFHTFFNVVNTLILVWFIPYIIRIVDWMVPVSGEEEDDEFRLRYIPGNYMDTAELNIETAKQEIENFSKRVLRMYSFLPALRAAKDEEEFFEIFKRIEKYEGITDRMEQEITRYLTRVSESDLSQRGSQRISGMLRIIDNLESIGDTIYQIAILYKNKRNDAVHFGENLNVNLEHMAELVQHAFNVMNTNLYGRYSDADLNAAYQAEDAVNRYRDELRERHLADLREGVYDYSIGSVYSGLYALYEKTADYVINVSEAVCGGKRR